MLWQRLALTDLHSNLLLTVEMMDLRVAVVVVEELLMKK